MGKKCRVGVEVHDPYDLTTNYSEYAHPFGVARPPSENKEFFRR